MNQVDSVDRRTRTTRAAIILIYMDRAPLRRLARYGGAGERCASESVRFSGCPYPHHRQYVLQASGNMAAYLTSSQAIESWL
jgi:hypothetical protein